MIVPSVSFERCGRPVMAGTDQAHDGSAYEFPSPPDDCGEPIVGLILSSALQAPTGRHDKLQNVSQTDKRRDLAAIHHPMMRFLTTAPMIYISFCALGNQRGLWTCRNDTFPLSACQVHIACGHCHISR